MSAEIAGFRDRDSSHAAVLLAVAGAELGDLPALLRDKGYDVSVFFSQDELRKMKGQETLEGIEATLYHERYLREALEAAEFAEVVYVSEECRESHLGAAILGLLETSNSRYPANEVDLLMLFDDTPPRRFNDGDWR